MSPGFLTILGSPIEQTRARLRVGLEALPTTGDRPFPPQIATIETMLFSGVRDQLERIVTPTLALEMNVARLRGELNGETTGQRYDSYIALLSREAYREALAAEYPALFQLAAERLDTWVDVSLELAGRLAGDWPAIQEIIFDGNDPGQLAGMRFLQRTTKRGGRLVVAPAFASGAKLVYKPRSLAAEARFQELLAWLNGVGFAPEFKPLRVLDFGTHGWMEWIDPADCADAGALRRFYRRQGAYLALFYALEATDIHMSNIIAAGEHPLLIDMEALFHPREAAEAWPALELALDEQLYYSVLRPGLLPEPEKGDDESLEPLDLSGLAGVGGQLTPYTVPTWKERQTDSLHLARERKPIKGARNLPTLRGRTANPGDYLDELDEGFAAAYRLLAANKDALLAPGGLLDSFAGVELRLLPRSGRNYGDILEAGYHPDLLRDPAARQAYFGQRLRPDEDDRPELGQLVPHEVAALLAGDVPLFVTRAGSRDVMTPAGGRIPDFFPRSGLEAARRRIATLDEADLAHQRRLIRASFATVTTRHSPEPRRPIVLPDEAPADLPEQALAEAVAIGEWLAQTAIRAGDEVSWIGLEPDEAGHWFIEPLGDDLGFGLPGVALFLSLLAAHTGDERRRELARAAMNTYLRHAAEDRAEAYEGDEDHPIGLLFGLGGRLYALSQPAVIEAHAGVQAEIGRLVGQVERLLQQPDDEAEIGLAHGLAGCLTGLLAAHFAAQDSAARTSAELAGDRLLARLDETADELPNELFAAYYHGPWGAIAPLLALSALTGQGRYRAAAERLLAALPGDNPTDPGAWLAYLAARPWLPETGRERLDDALRRALPDPATRVAGRNHSLWYGDMGYIDLLVNAAAALEDAPLARPAGRYAAAVIADIQRHGRRTAIPLGVESPGFAAGLAGIGYGLLRVAAPEATPFPVLAARRGVT